MTSRDFCYWLQGLFELSDCDQNKARTNGSLSIEQTQCIKDHLASVFKHEIAPRPPIPGSGIGSAQATAGSLTGAILGPGAVIC